MTVDPEDAAQQLLAKAVHHRHDDDQGGHPQGDAEQGEAGDDGDKAFLAAGAQVTHGHHTLEGAEDHGLLTPVSLAKAESKDSSSRSPLARALSSTTPDFRPRGSMISCQGKPIKSISANLVPADSSRSS